MGLSSNALIAKIRAIYGKNLKSKDYELLLKKKTIPEITGFLKTNPNYKEVLDGVNENSVNRSRLEGLIRKQQFQTMMRLVKFNVSNAKGFYNIHIIAKEHQVILSMIKSFISDENYDIIADLPLYFNQHSKLNIEEIAYSKNLKELCEALKDSTYYKIFKPYEKVANEDIKYYIFESLLESQYYQYVFNQINKYFKSRVKEELIGVFTARIEMSNMIKIYRLKKYYEVSDSDLRNMLISSYTRLSANKIEQLIQIKNPDDILKMIVKSDYQKLIGSQEQVYLEYFTDYMKFRVANKLIYYSQHPAKVYLAYMILSELEIENITHLIEGTRYRVDERQIRKLLVY